MAVYDAIGAGYAALRRPDPRIERLILDAVGMGTVVNIGAGTGSYEPREAMVAVEPSAVMVAQRTSPVPVVRAAAEALPLRDGLADVALAVLTTHHWSDLRAGLAELQRVAAQQVVLTWDQEGFASRFWFVADYLPEAAEREAGLGALRSVLEVWPDATVTPVPVPHDCTDGFFAAWWRRPEAYLDPAVRAAISGLALLDQDLVERAVEHLRRDLADGTWERRHGHLRGLDELDCGYRLVVHGAAPGSPGRSWAA